MFWPRPKVFSAFLQIVVDDELRGRIADRKAFHDFVRDMFLHRRKFLRSELLTAVKGRLAKAVVEQLVGQLRLRPAGPSG